MLLNYVYTIFKCITTLLVTLSIIILYIVLYYITLYYILFYIILYYIACIISYYQIHVQNTILHSANRVKRTNFHLEKSYQRNEAERYLHPRNFS